MDPRFWHLFDFKEALRAIAVIGITTIALLAFRRMIASLGTYATRGLRDREGAIDTERVKQANTVISLLRQFVTVVILLLGGFMVLRELGVSTEPFLTILSVLVVAAGFGAQNFMRDVISGFFIIADGQIRVNDVAVINDTPGTVEEINLRTTVLRDESGTVHVFANGNITKLANKTREYSFFIFTLHISYRDNPEQALEILSEVVEEMRREPTYSVDIWGPLDIIGVESLAEPAMVVKAKVKTRPGRQWAVGFEAHRRLKHRFHEAGLEFPSKGGGLKNAG